MATAEVLTLSSPPNRQFSIYDIPSSPLPTISDILRNQKQTIQSASDAALIPKTTSLASRGATLFHNDPLADTTGVDTTRYFQSSRGGKHEADLQIKKPSKTRKLPITKKDAIEDSTKPKKPRKPRAKKVAEVIEGDGVTKSPLTRKPRTKKAEKEVAVKLGITQKPARKSRSKKTEVGSQTKLPRGNVTKVSAISPADKLKDALTESNTQSPSDFLDPPANSFDLGLIEAVKRRTTWTPPKTKTKVSSTAPADLSCSNSLLGLDGSVQSEKNGFADLIGNFAFTKVDSSDKERRTVNSHGIRKRKLVELVKTSASTTPSTTPKIKEKAPRKKPKTLTDQATSAYAEVEEEPTRPAPLLQYFSFQTTDRATSNEFKIAAKLRSKSPTKSTKKQKRGSAEAPILLSPESALKQVGNQDFVFGTSSQLAREDSPTFLRDIHQAMQASNEADDDPFVSSPARGQAGHNLWAAASRDRVGQLLDVEMIDLVDSPDISKRAQLSTITHKPSVPEEDDDIWHELGDTPSCPLPLVDPLFGSAAQHSGIGAEFSSPSKRRPSSPPPRKLPEPKEPKESQLPSKPDYNGYTTSELAKEIASYRFKPIRSRNQMIALLEKCWEGKHRTTLGILDPNLKVTKPALPIAGEASPKRPRGRPRKDSSTALSPKDKSKISRPKVIDTVAFLELDSDTPLSQIRIPKKRQRRQAKTTEEEIFDSDSPSPPSPPRGQAAAINATSLPLDVPVSSGIETSPELSPEACQKRLFAHITRAVTSAPASKDPLKPNWHEKMLLYDPIVLEDLTVWLNTGALQQVGWDGEVDRKEVKKWCDSKSVCCLWKINLRGVARSRY